MIILEQANRIVESTLKEKFQTASKESTAPFSIVIADFDKTLFQISSNESQNITVSVLLNAADTLKRSGADNYLKSIYGPQLVSPESGYSFSIAVAAKDGNDQIANKFALLKRHAFASVFHQAFKDVEQGKNEIYEISYRPNEKTFLVPKKDRLTIVYSVNFKDPDDVVFGKVFLNEFKKSLSGAPPVDFSQTNPPGEIASLKKLDRVDGYVTMVLFDRHYKPESRDRTIDMAIIFRNYLMYHIKCSKSHLNTRMRVRVESLLKILNRAKQDLPKEKKTSTGRTFNRSGAPPSNAKFGAH